MASLAELILLGASIIVVLAFLVRFSRIPKITLIHKLYSILALIIIVWMLCIIAINITDRNDKLLMYILDSVSYLGAFVSVFGLLIAFCFINAWEKMPRKYYLLFVIPVLTNIAVWTNPLHHLYYKVFSVVPSEIVFGPLPVVSGVYTYICMVIGIVSLFMFAARAKNRLYIRQSVMFALGSFFPLVVNLLVTFELVPLSNVATPLSLITTIVFHGIAIWQLHFLDIKPVAMQRILDWISDGYIVISPDGLVVDFNKPFDGFFAKRYGILENVYLRDCAREGDLKSPLYNLISSVETCRRTGERISYEQTFIYGREKSYYIAQVAPLVINEETGGFVAIYKDVTSVKESMERLAASQVRLVERDRLASLGQMVGGLAHNLKTPIMSISGGTIALDNLIQECGDSLGDDEVTLDDFREIYGEMSDWTAKMREACTYMSDIITAVKGQATNMDSSEGVDFSMDEVMKRAGLLLRHELIGGGCHLVFKSSFDGDVILNGDINNLVQVLNNLITNAIDASTPLKKDEIIVSLDRDEEWLKISVTDFGTGVSKEVGGKLFRQMITSKGAQGTGLGLYISDAVIRGKFGGYLEYADNPNGGSVFTVKVPMENVKIGNEGEQK